jgi:hypothetical protein
MNEDPPRPPRAAWVEAALAVSLSVAALTTAWASNQASLWDGEQAANYSRAGAVRAEANKAFLNGGQLSQIDVLMFSAWLSATASRQPRLIQFYETRFRPEFRPAFQAWMTSDPINNPDAPPSPFALPQYKVAERTRAEGLEARAAALFEEGQRDNDISDSYLASSLILATSLFLSGISQTFRVDRLRWALAVAGCIACAIGVVAVLLQPIAQMPLPVQ